MWGSDALPEPAADTIEGALARDADFVVENAGLVTLWQSEWRHLKPTARAHNVAIQRRYVQGFIDLLLERRTELTAAHAETMVVAALALIMGAAVHPHNELEGPELAALLSGMAVSSLGITETS